MKPTRDTAYNRWISDLHWIRSGQQKRSRETQEKLLDAAEYLIIENGVAATSVANVALEAGCSVGAVYHHFSDKQALVYALFERLRHEFQALSAAFLHEERWVGASIGDILGAYAELLLNAERDRPAFRLTGTGVVQSDDMIRGDLIELRRGINRGLTRLLLERGNEIDHPEPSQAIAFILDQIVAMVTLRQHKLPAASEMAPYSDAVFVDELVASACCYLGIAR